MKETSKDKEKKSKGRMIFLCILVLLIGVTAWFEHPVTENISIDAQGKIDTRVRIALITDLHSCYYGKGQSQLLRMIEKENVDLILLAGDIFDDRMDDENAKALIEGICEKYPCCYVTGNHEFWGNKADAVKAFMKAHGVMVGEGTYFPVEIKGNTLILSGVDDPTYLSPDEWKAQLDAAYAEEYPDKYQILLSHRPERGKDYSKYDFDLVVSGHAHGGQWGIPFTQKGVAAPDQGLFPTVVDGLYQFSNGTDLVVSRGLCRERMPFPRFFNHPEIVILELE